METKQRSVDRNKQVRDKRRLPDLIARGGKRKNLDLEAKEVEEIAALVDLGYAENATGVIRKAKDEAFARNFQRGGYFFEFGMERLHQLRETLAKVAVRAAENKSDTPSFNQDETDLVIKTMVEIVKEAMDRPKTR